MVKGRKLRFINYEGQALAIILIVLVVAVIIGLAVLSRTLSDRQRVTEEGASVDSSEIADVVLSAVKEIPFDEFEAFVVSEEGINLCVAEGGNPEEYVFSEDGCSLEGLSEFEQFLNYFSGLDLTAFYNAVSESLLGECKSSDADIKLIFSAVDAEEEIEIEKDSVFAVVNRGEDPTASSCELALEAWPVGASEAALVASNFYADVDDDGSVQQFKSYEYSDISGYCLWTGCSGNVDWTGWTEVPGTVDSPATLPPIPVVKGGYNLYESRLKAVHNDVAVKITFQESGAEGGSACLVREDLIRASAIVNCAGNSRGKEFVISSEEWAPPIFDYVLFNGDGQLENQ